MADEPQSVWALAITAGARAGAYVEARRLIGGRGSFGRWEGDWRNAANDAIAEGLAEVGERRGWEGDCPAALSSGQGRPAGEDE